MKQIWKWFFVHNRPLLFGKGPEVSEIDTLIGAHTRVQGTLEFSESARIDGFFEGNIRTEGCLIVGEHARVEGEFRVGVLIVHGTVKGDVWAKEAVEIKRSGKVLGKVQAHQIGIEPGGQLEGEIERVRPHHLF